MILIKGAEIYSPEYLGIKDVLISDDKITLIEDEIDIFSNKINIIDGSNFKLIPGFIDQHVHITGGGGEGSFKTRVPEITLTKLTKNGITTVVGLLGTDGTSRSIENLLAKAKALKEEGITVYAHTGSYEYPTVTLTGSVKKDIMFIEEIIGAKVALSDHRSSSITCDELARVASDARMAGMLSGKAGLLVIHMGDGKRGLKTIYEVIENYDIPIGVFRPTHVNRNKKLLAEAFDFAKLGGIIDLTCGVYKGLTPGDIINMAVEKNVPLDNITFSSDGYGSWSRYDEKGNMIEIGVSQTDTLYETFKSLVLKYGYNMEKALKFFTTNVSRALSIYPQKGTIREGCDADILLLDKDFKINTVIANGRIMIKNGEILIKGTYE